MYISKLPLRVLLSKHTQYNIVPSGMGVPAMMHLSSTSAPADATVSWRGNSNTGASIGSSSADTYESSEESAWFHKRKA